MFKESWLHRGSKGGRGSCGAWQHAEQGFINSLFPSCPPLSGKSSLQPMLKDAVLAGDWGSGHSSPSYPIQPSPNPSLVSYPGGLGPTCLVLVWQNHEGPPFLVRGGESGGLRSQCSSVESRTRRCGPRSCGSTHT